MATITVTNLNDSGPGSLRAAIAGAAAGDIITFDAGLSGGVLRLASTLSVPVAITIDGDLNNDGRPDITISGDANNNDVHAAGSTTISNIVASAADGKISDNVRVMSASGDITIDGLIITGGTATGHFGGGILALGSINVSHSLIAGNTADIGGGLFANSGAANITASTLSGNSATGSGGSAVIAETAVNLTNVTVSGNTTSGTFTAHSDGTATVINSTITGNTAQFGGLTAIGTLTITNSISVANQGGDAASNAPIVYTGLNIIGIGGDTNGADGRINAPSLAAVFASVAANPFSGVTSGVLTDSGSGVPTVALNPSATNPALDASNASAPATDARGTARQDLVSLGNNGSNFADLGAFEVTDQAPLITAVPLFATIAEDTSTAAAIKVSTLSVVDADGNNTLSLSGADAALFEIQADGIYLKSGTILDFETNPVLDVTLDVVTLGFGTNSASASINVTDVNEAPTAVAFANVTGNLDELLTFTPARIKIADINVTDDALGSETLDVTGADANFFEIDNGVLYFKQGLPLDYEFKSSFSVAVTVDDPTLPGIELTSAPITLTLNDVNEGPSGITIFSPVILAEDTSTVTRIKISDITVTDDALGTNTLTLGGADAALFELFDGDVYLKAGVTLDFETQSTLIVDVTVEDPALPGSALNSADILVQLTDVNEAPTAVTLANTVVSLAEGTPVPAPLKIADILVTDDALGVETITLSGADASCFEIIAGALFLKAGTVLDFETDPVLDVTLNVDDPTVGGAVDATTSLSVAVTDVNEAPTALALSNTLASIAENASTAARRKIADITVTDDALGTEVITVTGADAALFEIFDGDLYLKAGAKLDFETNRKLDVTVNVDDPTLGSGIELSRSLSVAVTDALETISGSSGSNMLAGTSGADRINAGAGNDTVNGGGGDDIIHGGAGVDRLTGGTGRDTFVFKSLTESGYHASGSLSERGPLTDQAAIGQRDIITDFTPGFDEIDLSAIDANTTVSGNQAFTFRGTGSFAGAGSLVYRKFDNAGTANDRTIVFADANGDDRSDFQIELTGLKTLSAGDFVL